MNKGVLLGAGAGLAVLAFLGGYWLAQSESPGIASDPATIAQPTASEEKPTSHSVAAPDQDTNSYGLGATDGGDTAANSTLGSEPPVVLQGRRQDLSPEERQRARAAIRAKLSELTARKSDMSIEDLREFVKDLRAISQGELEPAFLDRMGQMFERSEQVNQLSQELQKLADSQKPEDRQRQREILKEIETLSQQIRLDTTAMQAISRQRLASRRAEIEERKAQREAAKADATNAAQEAAR